MQKKTRTVHLHLHTTSTLTNQKKRQKNTWTPTDFRTQRNSLTTQMTPTIQIQKKIKLCAQCGPSSTTKKKQIWKKGLGKIHSMQRHGFYLQNFTKALPRQNQRKRHSTATKKVQTLGLQRHTMVLQTSTNGETSATLTQKKQASFTKKAQMQETPTA